MPGSACLLVSVEQECPNDLLNCRLGFMAVQQALRIGNPHYYGCQKKFPETGMTNPENPKVRHLDTCSTPCSTTWHVGVLRNTLPISIKPRHVDKAAPPSITLPSLPASPSRCPRRCSQRCERQPLSLLIDSPIHRVFPSYLAFRRHIS